MILEVQIQSFGASARSTQQRTHVKVFIFKNFQGPQISIFLCENWQEASFYNKEQMQIQIWNLCLKTILFLLSKKRVLVFEETPPKKKNVFFVF